jgi:hypothetical protein
VSPRRHRSLLLRIEVREAGRQAQCRHDRTHLIERGDVRFIVRNPGPAGGEKGYCAECGAAMLESARRELDEIERQL